MRLHSVDITTAPSIEPVTATEVKNFSKIDFTDDDSLLTIQIKSARQTVEKWLGKALITQTITAYWTNFDNRVYLPYAPHQSVTSATKKRRAESETLTVNTDFYVMGVNDLYLDLEPTGVTNPRGTSREEMLTAWNLEVVYVAGYGVSATDVPAPIREAIMKIVETNYDNRGNIVVGSTSSELPNSAKALIAQFRSPEI